MPSVIFSSFHNISNNTDKLVEAGDSRVKTGLNATSNSPQSMKTGLSLKQSPTERYAYLKQKPCINEIVETVIPNLEKDINKINPKDPEGRRQLTESFFAMIYDNGQTAAKKMPETQAIEFNKELGELVKKTETPGKYSKNGTFSPHAAGGGANALLNPLRGLLTNNENLHILKDDDLRKEAYDFYEKTAITLITPHMKAEDRVRTKILIRDRANLMTKWEKKLQEQILPPTQTSTISPITGGANSAL